MEAARGGGMRLRLRAAVLSVAVMAMAMAMATRSQAQLQVGFYDTLCPAAEIIVQEEVSKVVSANPGMAAGLVRLHFHDCFVRGCDASVLLDSTAGNQAEKDAPPNTSLRGFDVIDKAKARLEQACFGVVSCADVLAFAARDALALVGGNSYQVPAGRRDGNLSVAQETNGNLPPPAANGAGERGEAEPDVRRQGADAGGHGGALRGAHHRGVALQLLQQPALLLRPQRRPGPQHGPQLRGGADAAVPAAAAGAVGDGAPGRRHSQRVRHQLLRRHRRQPRPAQFRPGPPRRPDHRLAGRRLHQ
uniref:Peroxidase n=1 Tax=Oryza brachyantha TaxID=4533 RepID=J3LJD7_ORYBR